MNAAIPAARPLFLKPARSRLCPLCEEALLQFREVWLCGWCGFRIGVAEPHVSHQQVADATAHFLAQGGKINRLPDGPGEEEKEEREEKEDEAGEEKPQEEQSQSPAREQETG